MSALVVDRESTGPPPEFVGGTGRSGISVTGRVLGHHLALLFPNMRMIHSVRDPSDVMRSVVPLSWGRAATCMVSPGGQNECIELMNSDA